MIYVDVAEGGGMMVIEGRGAIGTALRAQAGMGGGWARTWSTRSARGIGGGLPSPVASLLSPPPVRNHWRARSFYICSEHSPLSHIP